MRACARCPSDDQNDKRNIDSSKGINVGTLIGIIGTAVGVAGIVCFFVASANMARAARTLERIEWHTAKLSNSDVDASNRYRPGAPPVGSQNPFASRAKRFPVELDHSDEVHARPL